MRRRVTKVDPLSASRVFALLLFVQGFISARWRWGCAWRG